MTARTRERGPRVHLSGSCYQCRHLRDELGSTDRGSYAANIERTICTHPSGPNREIASGLSNAIWHTPGWCPELIVAAERLVRRLKRKAAERSTGDAS